MTLQLSFHLYLRLLFLLVFLPITACARTSLSPTATSIDMVAAPTIAVAWMATGTATSTATPTLTPTPTPTLTPTDTLTATPSPSATSSPTPSATPTELPPPTGRIVYERWPENERGGYGSPEIWIVDADGQHRRQLTSGHSDHSPAPSPSGRWVAFTRLTEGIINGWLYVINSEGTGLQRIFQGDAAVRNPQWLSDDLILFRNLRGPKRGWLTISLTTRQINQITWLPDERFGNAVVAPDRERFAITDTSVPLVQDPVTGFMKSVAQPIYIANWNNRTFEGLVDPDGNIIHGWAKVWHPNGQQLIVQAMSGGCLLLYMDDNKVNRVADITQIDKECTMAWSPDGLWAVTGKGFDNGYGSPNRLVVGYAVGYGRTYTVVPAGDIKEINNIVIPSSFFRNPVWFP
jgi:hypothetical protein